MTGSLVVPLESRPAKPVEPGRTAFWFAAGCLALASFGLIVWFLGYSPRTFDRFEGTAVDRTIDFGRAGDYVLYEEFPGASQPALPSPMALSVRTSDGVELDVESLHDPGEIAAPAGYHSWGHEGRAMARFTVEEPGVHRLVVRPRGVGVPEDYGSFRPVTFAVAPAATMGWMGAWWATFVLGGLPGVVGLTALWASSRARRSAAQGQPVASQPTPP